MQIPREQLVLFSWESWYQSSRENETKWFPEGPVASHADVLKGSSRIPAAPLTNGQ